MKGYRFYEEYRDKRKREPANNIVAILINEDGGMLYDDGQGKDVAAVVGVFDHGNSDVGSGSVGLEWLRENCKRIPESKARLIHPKLFEYLEYEP